MARIEWVKQRLNNWALWKEREGRGSLGFYTASAFTKMVVDTSGYRELMSTVDDIEAQATDEAVQSLLGDHAQLHRTLVLIYLEDTGIRRAAGLLACAESTVKARLEQADHHIATFLRIRAQARENQRQGGFTS
jgi:DNA-directed RNA polymerase specialized sigma24 family protein